MSRRALSPITLAVATLAATLSWLVVALIAADVAGWLPGGDASATGPPPRRAEDPCGLRALLPTGTDARCTFPLARADGPLVAVELEQRWEANVLVQMLVAGDGRPHPLFALTARSAGARPLRLQRLFAIPGPEGREHIAYLVGLCGGTTCGTSEFWVVDPVVGGVAPLVKLSVSRTPAVHMLVDGSVEVVESADRFGVDALLVHSIRWRGERHVVDATFRQRSGPR